MAVKRMRDGGSWRIMTESELRAMGGKNVEERRGVMDWVTIESKEGK